MVLLSKEGGGKETEYEIEQRVLQEHKVVKREGVVLEGGRGRVKRSKCSECSKKSTWVCSSCINVCLCQGVCAENHVQYFIKKQFRKAGYV